MYLIKILAEDAPWRGRLDISAVCRNDVRATFLTPGQLDDGVASVYHVGHAGTQNRKVTLGQHDDG
jgi:hypothetical protein